MNTLNNFSTIDDENDTIDFDTMSLQQMPSAGKYPAHMHCLCMQPIILIMRQTYITTLRRIDDQKTITNRLLKSEEPESPDTKPSPVTARQAATRGVLTNMRMESPATQSVAA